MLQKTSLVLVLLVIIAPLAGCSESDETASLQSTATPNTAATATQLGLPNHALPAFRHQGRSLFCDLPARNGSVR